MSRVEREQPKLVEKVIPKALDLLVRARYPGTPLSHEDLYREKLARYLRKKTKLRVEEAPSTPFGKPDILVEAVLALETKRSMLTKKERDRCVGQCADYSREWVTAIILFDTPLSRVQVLADLLRDKGLDHIGIVPFIEVD